MAPVDEISEVTKTLARVPAGTVRARTSQKCEEALRYVDEALALVKLAALKERDREFGNFDAARIYAQLGDKDAAFEALNRASEVRESSFLGAMSDPYLDPLRGDSRYPPLVERFGLSG